MSLVAPVTWSCSCLAEAVSPRSRARTITTIAIARPPVWKLIRILGTVVAKTLAPESDESPALRIYLAGGIALVGADGSAVAERALAGRQGRRLLVRLAAIHEPVPTADLADDLWGPEWPTAWQVALRALASKLRTALARVGAPDALGSTGGTYALTLPAGTWLDLDEAGAAMHRAEAALMVGDLTAAATDALIARSIASRTLLPGEDGEWLDVVRSRLA